MKLESMMNKSQQHQNAQDRLTSLLSEFYIHVSQEQEITVPNPAYLYDRKTHSTITYWFDVFAQGPKDPRCKFQSIGIEIDGRVGHKKTKKQYIRDNMRTKHIQYEYNINIQRFDTQQIVGGYTNPKTKRKTPPLTDKEILEFLGIHL